MIDESQILSPAIQSEKPKYWGRVLLLKIILLVFLVIVLARLVKIQVLDSSKYQEIAKRQYEVKVSIPAIRGGIYDRNGNVLVSNTRMVSYAADPKIIGDDINHVAEVFAGVFQKPASVYINKLQTPKRFVWLERRVPPNQARRIAIDEIEGVVELDEPQRLYHYDDLAGQILGVTNIDNVGLSGIELQFDKVLKGTDGFVIMQRDGLGRKRPSVDYPRIDPIDGNNVTLTIDFTFQSVVQEELKRGVEANNANGGIAVMLQPKTGEVLAMATYPAVKPNDISEEDTNKIRNRPLTDMFEPGSTFKIVVASAALEEKLHRPADRINAEGGVYKTSGRTIRDTHGYRMLTFQEGMEYSSNIVMAKISDDVGSEKLFRYARDFGFGIPTGIELPGEIGGQLKKPAQWSKTTLNTMAYGYEVGVTPIQIASAYAAVANGGELMKPFIIRKAADKNGNVLFERTPEKIRKVISQETAQTLTSFFEGVVERGTGKDVKINGVRIAGKTGTASKLGPGGYSKDDYVASFVGFFPVEDPQVVLLVMIDRPHSGQYYGGMVSGPVFRAIAERIINLSDPQPHPEIYKHYARQQSNGERVTVPDVRYLGIDLASSMCRSAGLAVQYTGSGNIVASQNPAAAVEAARNDKVQLVLAEPQRVTNKKIINTPDLRGLSIRRAVNALKLEGLDAVVNGNGIVIRQAPTPGEIIRQGNYVQFWCEPRGFSTVVVN
ncbi:MAG: penicillin-binding transpeptidase domain-containing protein [Bacteroidota bacterium]